MKRNHQDQIILYMHAGSGNHGCEAIVNSLCHMLTMDKVLVSYRGTEDERYTLKELCEIKTERGFAEHKLMHLLYYAYRLLTKDAVSFVRYRYGNIFTKPVSPLAVSIGGDNYCYDSMLSDLRLANRAFAQCGTKTVLLGCSIEPALLMGDRADAVLEDLSRYRLIIAREALTYDALCEAFDHQSVYPKPRIVKYPDPAFTLQAADTELPEGFVKGNTIGINVSPLIQKSEAAPGITMKCYEELIRYLLAHTDMQIALIPHVVWENNDDRKPLLQLYEEFQETGRLVLVPDGSCEELKGIISRCRFFIGARTHATIAAYSTCVPTLVVGYSVKAAGIAKELFGQQEHYVIPVQSLKNPQDLVQGFTWLAEHEQGIRKHLEDTMPEVRTQALLTGEEINRLWEE